MCLILFSYRNDPRYDLIFAANRDEFYHRPADPISFWREAPHVLAGKDLTAGGTWFGITRDGRIAAITNYRDPASLRSDAPSRGLLVSRFLTEAFSPEEYLDLMQKEGGQYNGFSLLFGDLSGLYYFSNRSRTSGKIAPGTYGLSNRFLDTPWPKVIRGKEALSRIQSGGGDLDPALLFSILADTSLPEEKDLPETGVGREWERLLSPLFISAPGYGTRSSTVVLIDKSRHALVEERTFNSHPEPIDKRRFEFDIEA